MLLVVVPSAPVWADCMPIAGTEHVLEPGTVVLLGEIHGTREGPETVSRLACAALEQGQQVTVALEIPQNEAIGHQSNISRERTKPVSAICFLRRVSGGATTRTEGRVERCWTSYLCCASTALVS